MSDYKLFENKKDCCGCGVCSEICPQNAITMTEDKYGFIYPEIDTALCIGCGACKKKCAFQNINKLNKSKEGYVAANTDTDQIKKSSSGGVFAALATAVLRQNGIVFGASYVFEQSKLSVRHIGIESEQELYRIQGSKYVQSDLKHTYQDVKDELMKGRIVLFSGTPCQVSALYFYLSRDFNNLYTVDVICHGVPNQQMFREYLKMLSSNIKEFNFRDKKFGWEDYYITYKIKNNKKKHVHCRISSYYEYFLKGKIFREGCYSCKYACETRVSDLTLGDYWGIRSVHPELFIQKAWIDKLETGISCVLVNTDRGGQLLDTAKDRIEIVKSELDKIIINNGQLCHPSEKPEEYEDLFNIYSEKGYKAIDKIFIKNLGLKKYLYNIKSIIPKVIKKKIKKLFNIV